MAPKTNVYVDGFNVYFAIRNTPYRWLDLAKMFDTLLAKNDVQRIRYFTARIKARPNDPTGPARQQVYLDALASNPRVSIHYGRFLASKVRMRLTNPPPPPAGATVEVHKMEEKGSDVNLATWMLTDAFDNDADVSVLVSNDSDLAEPFGLLSKRFGQTVGLVTRVRTSASARCFASNARRSSWNCGPVYSPLASSPIPWSWGAAPCTSPPAGSQDRRKRQRPRQWRGPVPSRTRQLGVYAIHCRSSVPTHNN